MNTEQCHDFFLPQTRNYTVFIKMWRNLQRHTVEQISIDTDAQQNAADI